MTPTATQLAAAIISSLVLGSGVCVAVSPPSEVRAGDTPSDSGGSMTVEWTSAPEERAGTSEVTGYEVLKAGPPAGLTAEAASAWQGPPDPASFKSVGFASAGQTSYLDPSVKDGRRYYYKVVTVAASGDRAESPIVGPAISSQQWLDLGKKWVFLWAVLLSAAVIIFIETAKRGRRIFVRKIAGLEAVNEAIGRATEMGRSIVYVNGTQDMNDIQTIAGVTILGHVAKRVAEYDTRLVVPTSRALVMTTARETVKQAFLAAGRPDAYREDDIYYTTDEQFGYVAAVNGVMVRSKPATCFYLGAFFAESLILAETGNSIGAIQIAGTAQPAQLPFFVAACDYTLIGEELFAAGAYLSGEPKQLGSLKGQDLGKGIAIAAILVGCLVMTAAALTKTPAFEWAGRQMIALFSAP